MRVLDPVGNLTLKLTFFKVITTPARMTLVILKVFLHKRITSTTSSGHSVWKLVGATSANDLAFPWFSHFNMGSCICFPALLL